MASLARRIWRERRRTGLVAGLAAISGALFYSHISATVAGIPLPLFIGVLYGIAFGLATLTVSLIAPRLRFAMEAFAVARLLYALTAAAVPGIAYAAITTPLLNATVVVLGGIAIARLACSGPMMRLRRPATVTLRLAAGAPATLAPALPALGRMGYAPGRGLRALLHAVALDACHVAERAETDRLAVTHREIPWIALAAAWIDDTHGRLADACLTPQAKAPAWAFRPA
jgi:hypothetical protein